MDVTDQFNQRKGSLFKGEGGKAGKKEETEKDIKEVEEENQQSSINESANKQKFVDGDSNKSVEDTKENQEIVKVSKDSHDEAISKAKNEEKNKEGKKNKQEEQNVQGNFGEFEGKPKGNDDHLNQAKVVTEETVDHIQKRINQQTEIKPDNKRDFTGLFLMFALIFSFGAMAFSIVNMLAPSGLNTSYYQKGVKFLNENSNDRFKALKQEMLDNIKALNNDMQKSMNEIKNALLQVSDNTKKLNQNMAQVQSNISSEISNQSSPDLSQLTGSISDLKASVDQIKSQNRVRGAISSVCPQNRAYGTVHGSSC